MNKKAILIIMIIFIAGSAGAFGYYYMNYSVHIKDCSKAKVTARTNGRNELVSISETDCLLLKEYFDSKHLYKKKDISFDIDKKIVFDGEEVFYLVQDSNEIYYENKNKYFSISAGSMKIIRLLFDNYNENN